MPGAIGTSSGVHFKKKPVLLAPAFISSAHHIDTPDRKHGNVRCCSDRRVDFGDVVCVRKFSYYFTFISEAGEDFNENVCAKQDRIVGGVEETEFGSFTVHHEQRSICPQISTKLTGSDDADRIH